MSVVVGVRPGSGLAGGGGGGGGGGDVSDFTTASCVPVYCSTVVLWWCADVGL